MLNFLNDEYIRSLKALYFINNSSHAVSIDEIATQIGSVRKTVATLLNIIKSDLADCNFDLRETSEKKYYLVSKNQTVIYLDDYILMCGKRSLLFSIVEELFDKGSINTIQFCNDRYISQTTFSRGKKKLTELLEKSQLKLANYVSDGIIGDEYQVRIFYFHFFNHFYYSLEWPFDSFQKEEIAYSIMMEKTSLFENLTMNQKRKLYYILAIMKKRMNQGYGVHPVSISFENNTQYKKIHAFVESYLNVHEIWDTQVIKNETNFFMCVLYTEDIVHLQTDYLEYLLDYSKDNPINTEISTLWIQTFKKVVKHKLTIEEEVNLHEELNKFHLSTEFLYCNSTLFLNNLSNQSDEKLNNEIYQYAFKFYQLLLKNKMFRAFREQNLKNVTDKYMIDRYYYYMYYSFLKLKKMKPINLFIADSIERIDKIILTRKLELLFGENIKIVENSIQSETLILTSTGNNHSKREEITIFSYKDEQNFKKVIQRIHEKIYEQLI
ncbi:helix-turn-helix domain-containing protein [Carnobacterium maltaromaticum]|uniref:helix-turn-helix domain-containing protein n=1 Tax=Carnobacterium maltaromaticum TaxID=2751 RepID=UPI00191B9413|nr:helix-turn-helix domain-containing protein [Carnobacterium maltaromaticum]CAD5899702.1 conserved hypothetical protein [Carnobacterium maltaromaticum]